MSRKVLGMGPMQILFFILILTSNLSAKEDLKKLHLLPMEIKVEKTELQKINVLSPDLSGKKLESLLEIERAKTLVLEKVFSSGSNIGHFIKLQEGDYQHLIIRSKDKEMTYWCSKDCEKLEKFKDKNVLVLVLWQEVEKMIPESHTKVKMKEATHIFINTKDEISFYPCEKYRTFPHIQKGCSGEACGILRYNRAIKSVAVYEKIARNSTVLGELKKCDNIEGYEAYTSIDELGWLKVTSPNKRLKEMGVKRGDLIQSVFSLGEGDMVACLGNQEINVDVSNVESVLALNSEDWIRVKLKSGRIGYVPETENFYMNYYGYDPSRFCPEDHPCGPDFFQNLKLSQADLSESFTKLCKTNEENAQNGLIKNRIWADYKNILPDNVQCVGVSSSNSTCGKTWEGSVSCSCKVKGIDENLYYYFNCSNNNGINCQFSF